MQRAELAAQLGFANGICASGDAGRHCLYLEDFWNPKEAKPSASDGKMDFGKYTLIAGVPYSCLWIAPGSLEAVDPETGQILEAGGSSGLVWRQSYTLRSVPLDVTRVHSVGVQVVYR